VSFDACHVEKVIDGAGGWGVEFNTFPMIMLELPRFAGRVAKGYAAFFFSKQSSNASGVS
jgi:hypothetical protein